tara:strand:- start:181 stop:1056 length:876 start_codon:yes stop_codon:yes gene_type:complete
MPVFTRPLLDVTGCDIPGLDLSSAEKAIMELVGSEDGAFQNPIESAMGEVQGAIGGALAEINNLGGASAGITISVEEVVGEDGTITTIITENPLGSQTTFGFLADNLEGVNSNIDDFRIHSDRLSGVSIKDAFGSDTYGPGGIQGEYPGLAGLHSVASQFNSLKETLRDPAQAAEDHYSPIFNSLFGPGDDMMRSMNSLVDGDVGNFLTNFPTGGVEGLEDLSRLGAGLKDFQASIPALINDDNLQFEAALDFIAKKTTGLSVLSMLDEPCFGTRLLGKIGTPNFKGLAGI